MKIVKRIIIFIALIILLIGAFITYRGYSIYKTAIEEVSIKDKIAQIQSEENYTKLDQLPQFYKDAVVIVEDRRFYDHGALDYRGIGRAIWTNIKSLELREGGSSITLRIYSLHKRKQH